MLVFALPITLIHSAGRFLMSTLGLTLLQDVAGLPSAYQPSPHSCIQKWFLSLAADSRRKHRSGYLVSAIYLQLELKGEKTQTRKENQILKCSSKDTVHVCGL